MSLTVVGSLFAAGPVLGFAGRSEAEAALPALFEARARDLAPGQVAGALATAHTFRIDGIDGFFVRTAATLVFDCQPADYVLLTMVDGLARVGEAGAGPGLAFALVPRKPCRIALDGGGLAMACLLPPEAMAGLSRIVQATGREAFRSEGILRLSLDQGAARLVPGLIALLMAALGLDGAAAPLAAVEMAAAPSPSIPRHVKRAEDYLMRHMAEPVTIAELAERVGASPRSLNRAFLRFRGMTPSRYLQNLRVEAAHRLLSSDDCLLDLRAVAARVGFGSYAPFWRAYVRRFGRPPSLGRRHGRDANP